MVIITSRQRNSSFIHQLFANVVLRRDVLSVGLNGTVWYFVRSGTQKFAVKYTILQSSS
jgi:hypothetical protein